MNWLDGVSSSLLQKGLDGVWARQNATLDNIANYETPDYKRKYVTFENELIAAMDDRKNSTRSSLVSGINSASVFTGVDETLTLRSDGNNVDIIEENIELTRAQLQYAEYTRQLTDHFARLRSAINGTR